MDKKKLNSRQYSWEVILYCSLEQLRDIVDVYPRISHYMYILHDRDFTVNVQGDSSPVKPHFHLYLTFKREISRIQLTRDLNFYLNDPNTIVVKENIMYIETSLSDCVDYALHKYNSDKAKYDISEITSDCIRFFRRAKAMEYDKGFSIIQDMENGYSLRSLAIKYGREFIINYSRYKEFYEDMRALDRNITSDD